MGVVSVVFFMGGLLFVLSVDSRAYSSSRGILLYCCTRMIQLVCVRVSEENELHYLH